ncbi:MAG TPA: GNAT family N-acetyltransferase [Candidatus Sulfopaludibacter sp.]|nr:GNAT family N-acetyltransferase [Terriglobia bacterium]HEV2447230.1 GNAT family N-acetyltransferase [Candidatus Sulfopaludibacter sp.]
MTPEIVDIRRFDARDFKPLLAAEALAWAEAMRWDYTPSAQLISSCLEEKRLSGYALLDGRRITGYSFFVYEGEKGLVGDLFVDGNGGGLRREHALLLLESTLETMVATPGIGRIEAQLPHFGAEELEACFRARDFEVYLRRFMVLRLRDRPGKQAPAVRTEDFIIEPWQRKHDPAVAQLLCATYRQHVDAVINDQYASIEGVTRLIENIVHLRGCGEHIPRASLVAFHRPTRRLAAVVALTAVRPGTGHIPQVAVAIAFQAKGLGSALMEIAFREAEAQGYHEVSLTVTDLNRGAVRLYERLGFETLRTFGAFVWNRPE